MSHNTETAFRRKITELLVHHLRRERILELLHIDGRVAALPGVEDLEVGPVVLRQNVRILCLELAQLLRPLRVGMEEGFDRFANVGGDRSLLS